MTAAQSGKHGRSNSFEKGNIHTIHEQVQIQHILADQTRTRFVFKSNDSLSGQGHLTTCCTISCHGKPETGPLSSD